MKVLVIGAGGREHALCWALAQSPRVTEVVCAPGNGGIAQVARCVPADQRNLDEMLQVVATEGPGLVVVGPELPLSLGLVDELERRGIRAFGPTQAAAMLETSKGYAKRFMQRHQIPTAHFAVCTAEQQALDSLDLFHLPVVIKADGLAAGKGVLICESKAEAKAAITGLFSGKLLGTVETSIVVEEFLTGEEISFLVLSDGKHASPLVPAQDHKRIGEGDTGLNTGGMGVYSTDEMIDEQMREWIMHRIVQPTLDGMAAEDAPFRGMLYCGLMMTARGPMVLEYNTRFGDPETQAILMRLDSDLAEALEACAEGRLSETELRWKPGASACVVASSAGYPGSYKTGFPITGLKDAAAVPGVEIFHAGTALSNGEIVTSGGRVLGVTAIGSDLSEALRQAYEALDRIHFEGMYFRRDIGHRALKKKS
ncbi:MULTISPECIES: phosphoribosylamine--glycine ligase [Acidobacterium]|uniref:Phosphoribosylamine--glycine ligase n=1 Tax=Acidobacterium capsulatum (strain ATCC 51196 / DSM 11244 / BCRC 80197 / JCM 7670 / NBRC 15755 / NCIMB 13165 / 161) TaxID=240015 RepID=C1F8W5_ACIC5|nr:MULTISPECIES: phosphoribosylamine--glycine ligase [Acidobacterium]ACO34599.1 phosphoribosylamine--glycine ligase [Acidobacterium capsulatum ATCC 51196]HCT59889.1 phosphoribosylamine--glycine ligase [Acidobacterium sp.]